MILGKVFGKDLELEYSLLHQHYILRWDHDFIVTTNPLSFHDVSEIEDIFDVLGRWIIKDNQLKIILSQSGLLIKIPDFPIHQIFDDILITNDENAVHTKRILLKTNFFSRAFLEHVQKYEDSIEVRMFCIPPSCVYYAVVGLGKKYATICKGGWQGFARRHGNILKLIKYPDRKFLLDFDKQEITEINKAISEVDFV